MPHPFQISPKRARAAVLVAEDTLSNPEIAQAVGISSRTLLLWKNTLEFDAKVQEARAAIAKKVLSQGVARVDRRIARLNRDWEKLQAIADERAAAAAEDETLRHVPGMRTGHLVRRLRGIGRGEDFQMVEEFVVDTALLGELRAIETQAEKTLGQAAPVKTDITTGGQPLPSGPDLRGLSEERLGLLEQILEEATRTGDEPD